MKFLELVIPNWTCRLHKFLNENSALPGDFLILTSELCADNTSKRFLAMDHSNVVIILNQPYIILAITTLKNIQYALLAPDHAVVELTYLAI